MLQKIKQFALNNLFIDHNKLTETQQENSDHQLQLATIALFIEMMVQDGSEHKNEKEAVNKAIQSCFKIPTHKIDELFLLAEEELKQSADYFQFTQLINKNFNQPQKIKIIENLWLIAFSDSQLDDLEEHMVRKIAELIHVPHMQFIKAKHRAQKSSNE